MNLLSRRFSSLLLALILISSALPVSAQTSHETDIAFFRGMQSAIKADLDKIPGLADLRDDDFIAAAISSMETALENLLKQVPAPEEEFCDTECLYHICRHYERDQLSQALLLEERRSDHGPENHDWVVAEMADLKREQLLRDKTFLTIDPQDLNLSGSDASRVKAQEVYPLAAGKELFKRVDFTPDEASLFHEAAKQEEEAYRNLQEGDRNMTVVRIDGAVDIYSRLQVGTPYAIGPRIWGARNLRDLGMPMAALVRYRRILRSLDKDPIPGWKGIVLEDIADLTAAQGLVEEARDSYTEALDDFSTQGREESWKRVVGKRSVLR